MQLPAHPINWTRQHRALAVPRNYHIWSCCDLDLWPQNYQFTFVQDALATQVCKNYINAYWRYCRNKPQKWYFSHICSHCDTASITKKVWANHHIFHVLKPSRSTYFNQQSLTTTYFLHCSACAFDVFIKLLTYLLTYLTNPYNVKPLTVN